MPFRRPVTVSTAVAHGLGNCHRGGTGGGPSPVTWITLIQAKGPAYPVRRWHGCCPGGPVPVRPECLDRILIAVMIAPAAKSKLARVHGIVGIHGPARLERVLLGLPARQEARRGAPAAATRPPSKRREDPRDCPGTRSRCSALLPPTAPTSRQLQDHCYPRPRDQRPDRA